MWNGKLVQLTILKNKSMHYDHVKAARNKANREKYEELKKFITSSNKKGKLSDWFPAHEHILSMENTIERQNKQIQEYRNFFSSLSLLMPRKSSIHDIIG